MKRRSLFGYMAAAILCMLAGRRVQASGSVGHDAAVVDLPARKLKLRYGNREILGEIEGWHLHQTIFDNGPKGNVLTIRFKTK